MTVIARDMSRSDTNTTETFDLTPTDPGPKPILEDTSEFKSDQIESDLRHESNDDNHDDNSPAPSLVTDQCTVEVHLTNGDLSHSDTDQTSINETKLNGHLSEDDETTDDNHNYKQPLLINQFKNVQNSVVMSPSIHPRSHSCSCTMSYKRSVLTRLRHKFDRDSLLSMSESPDIFHLRAPLVSMENLNTPSISDDSLTGDLGSTTFVTNN